VLTPDSKLRIVVALRSKCIQFVDNFVPQTKINVKNMINCPSVTWVDDNVNISGSDSNGKGRMCVDIKYHPPSS
jgi:hypothetical protein